MNGVRISIALVLGTMALYGLVAYGDLLGPLFLGALTFVVWPRHRKAVRS